MKKLLSAFLALALVMSLSIPVFAAGATGTAPDVPVSTKWVDASAPIEIQFQVAYKDQGNRPLSEGAYPKEELTFQIQADGTLPADVMPEVGQSGKHTVATSADLVTIAIPEYNIPGKYSYIIKQQAGKTLGVDYDDTDIKVLVIVKNNTPENIERKEPAMLKFVSFTATSADAKVNGLTNTYHASSDKENIFSLQKKVAGNMGANGVPFTFHVTLKNDTGKNIKTDVKVPGLPDQKWEGTTMSFDVQLTSGSDSATVISGIPAGVTYTVTEDTAHTTHVTAPKDINDPLKGYTASYAWNDGNSTSNATGTIGGAEADQIVITNTKENADGVKPQTGVYLEAMPYIILLAVAVIGLVLFVLKRRAGREY